MASNRQAGTRQNPEIINLYVSFQLVVVLTFQSYVSLQVYQINLSAEYWYSEIALYQVLENS
jgi:hypothetical protein